MLLILICLSVGALAGILSGVIGLGGGVVVLPALIYILGMEQHMAQGTTLAMMLPPIGILAVMNYYKYGYVDFKIAMLLCAGFVLGALFGSKLAILMNPKHLKMLCGVLFIVIGIKMTLFKN
jgi:uncharacterized membrane protein YfcA